MARDEDTPPGADPRDGSGDDRGAADAPARAPVTQQLGRVAALVLLVVFVVFAFDNAQHVDFSWLVGGTEVETVGGERTAGGVRLIVLLLAAFFAGAFTAGTAVAARARTKRKAAERR